MIPGEMQVAPGDIEMNVGRETVSVVVTNTGDRPIQVGSHYHFHETNAALRFDLWLLGPNGFHRHFSGKGDALAGSLRWEQLRADTPGLRLQPRNAKHSGRMRVVEGRVQRVGCQGCRVVLIQLDQRMHEIIGV